MVEFADFAVVECRIFRLRWVMFLCKDGSAGNRCLI